MDLAEVAKQIQSGAFGVEDVMEALSDANAAIAAKTLQQAEEMKPLKELAAACDTFLWKKLLESEGVDKFKAAGHEFKLYDFDTYAIPAPAWPEFFKWINDTANIEIVAKEINKTVLKRYMRENATPENPLGLPPHVKHTSIKKSSFTKAK